MEVIRKIEIDKGINYIKKEKDHRSDPFMEVLTELYSKYFNADKVKDIVINDNDFPHTEYYKI